MTCTCVACDTAAVAGGVVSTPGRVDSTPGRVASTPGRVDSTPGRVDSTPGRVDSTPAYLGLLRPGLERVVRDGGLKAVHVAVHGGHHQIHAPVGVQVLRQHHGVGGLSKVVGVRTAGAAVDDVEEPVEGHNHHVQLGQVVVQPHQQHRRHHPPARAVPADSTPGRVDSAPGRVDSTPGRVDSTPVRQGGWIQHQGGRRVGREVWYVRDVPAGGVVDVLHPRLEHRRARLPVEHVHMPGGGADDHLRLAVPVDVPHGGPLGDEAAQVALPHLPSAPVEDGDVTARVTRHNLGEAVVVHVRHHHLALHLAHLREVEGGFNTKEGGFNTREGIFVSREGGFNTGEGGFNAREGIFITREGGYNPREGGFNTREGGFITGSPGGSTVRSRRRRGPLTRLQAANRIVQYVKRASNTTTGCESDCT
eukprot:1189553-Prorocentrum_minimum.AAC.2